MQLLRSSLILVLVCCLAFSVPVSAQEGHVVDPAALARAVMEHAAEREADRAAIRAALNRPEVQHVASLLGVDAARLQVSVSRLRGGDLERAAAHAREVNQALSGGATTVVLSTTTIIIILLVIILIIVAVKD
jgi:hypothetical protein